MIGAVVTMMVAAGLLALWKDLPALLIGRLLTGAAGLSGTFLATTLRHPSHALSGAMLIALFLGLSLPVTGAGIALDKGASAPDTVLVFAVVVGLGVLVSGWALLGHRAR
jgi:hypothetical protein